MDTATADRPSDISDSVDVDSHQEDESDIDSDNDESICKSPQKSPLKLSSVLKRKRRLSDCGGPSNSLSDAEVEDVDDRDDGQDDFEDEEDDEDVVEQSKAVVKKADFQFKAPTFRKKQFIFHPFQSAEGELSTPSDPVTVTIPEQLAASYGLYIWPSSPVLAWYLWLHHSMFAGKRVLELGAGTALPGILLAKLGCDVTLSDSVTSPTCVANCREAVSLNSLDTSARVRVVPLSWGLVTSRLLGLANKLDWVIGSDLFFDPEVFEKLIFTVKWLLSNNPGCQFISTVQERSADWSIELLLKKYSLQCSYEHPHSFLRGTGIAPSDLTGDHNIFVLKIFLKT